MMMMMMMLMMSWLHFKTGAGESMQEEIALLLLQEFKWCEVQCAFLLVGFRKGIGPVKLITAKFFIQGTS